MFVDDSHDRCYYLTLAFWQSIIGAATKPGDQDQLRGALKASKEAMRKADNIGLLA